MSVTRRIVFPAIRLVLWAVIAVALVKIAFAGTDVTAAEDPLQPSAQIVDPTVPVTTGSSSASSTLAQSSSRRAWMPVRSQ